MMNIEGLCAIFVERYRIRVVYIGYENERFDIGS